MAKVDQFKTIKQQQQQQVVNKTHFKLAAGLIDRFDDHNNDTPNPNVACPSSSAIDGKCCV